MTFLSDLRGLRGHTAQDTLTLRKSARAQSPSLIVDSHTAQRGLASPLSGGPTLRYGHPGTGPSQLLQRFLGQGSGSISDTAQSGGFPSEPGQPADKKGRARIGRTSQLSSLKSFQRFQQHSGFARHSCTAFFGSSTSDALGSCTARHSLGLPSVAPTPRQRTDGPRCLPANPINRST
jgi:hypothetical protein